MVHFCGPLSLELVKTIDCFPSLASCIAALDIMRASPYGGFKVAMSLIPQTPMFKVCDVYGNRV